MKRLAKHTLKAAVKRLPWGASEAIFEALCARMGAEEIIARLSPRVGHLHLCASGSYGLIQSALNDGIALPAYARTGVYEPRMAALFEQFFARHGGGTYLDIGANIGLTTIPVAQHPAVRCLAFEPDPVNSGHLRANVDRNCPHHNVAIHQVALFKDEATLDLALNQSNPGANRVRLGQQASGQTIAVEAVPLDRFLDQLDGAVAVKIDAEGAEPFVIAGGRKVLSRAALVALEFAPHHMRALGSDPNIVLEFLAGFERIGIGSVSGDDLPAFRPATEELFRLKGLLAGWRRGESRYWDVFASRAHRGAAAF